MRPFLLVLCVALGAAPSAAQFVSLHGGLARFDTERTGGLGEIEVGIPFARVGQDDAFVFDASVYAGLAQRADDATGCPAACTLGPLHNAYVGLRFGTQLNGTPLPVRFAVGVARYHERARVYYSDVGYFGGQPDDSSVERQAYAAVDLGVRLLVPLASAWSVEAGASTSLPLVLDRGALALTRFDDDRPLGPAALTLGVRWGR